VKFQKDNKFSKGRIKGSVNKERKELRILINTYLEINEDKFFQELNKLKSAQYIDRFLQLLEYGLGKLNRVDLTNDGDKFDFSRISDDELIGKLNEFTKFLNEKKSDSK